jgi:hypothetical protein
VNDEKRQRLLTRLHNMGADMRTLKELGLTDRELAKFEKKLGKIVLERYKQSIESKRILA